MDFLYVMLEAIKPYWAELIGTFLMASMINLVSIKGAQKESFVCFSIAFISLMLRDIAAVGFQIAPFFDPTLNISKEWPIYVELAFKALATSLFIVGAMRNLRLYFSAIWVVLLLTPLLLGISFLPDTHYLFAWIKVYIPPLYLIISLFIAGFSFYVSKTSRQNKVVRSVGNGLIVLSVCYGYQMFGLLGNIQQIILLCYTIAVVLSLASQVQFLNLHIDQLGDKLSAEKKSRYEIWEFSPFPIVISRLRDDRIIYTNPAARRMLFIEIEDVPQHPLGEYFSDPEKKEELMEQLRQKALVESFEVLIHSPVKGNELWISMTTRTTDLDEEIVLFSTFQDITETKETERRLVEEAATDPLTGLYNRRQFEILAYQALQTARRYGTPYSIAMLDIDFFKKVNDTYGHDAGDAVLKNLSKTLRKTLRKSDVVARFGGEEFIVFLPQTEPNNAVVAAEHIRSAVAQMVTVADGQVVPVTVSIGISDDKSMDLAASIKQADEALYYSKENGRNRVTLYRHISDSDKETDTSLIDKDAPAQDKKDTSETVDSDSFAPVEPTPPKPQSKDETTDASAE